MASSQLHHEYHQCYWVPLLFGYWNLKLWSPSKILCTWILRQHFYLQRLLCWQRQRSSVLWNDLVFGLPNRGLFQLLFPHLRRVFRSDAKLLPSHLRSRGSSRWTSLWTLHFDSELCNFYHWIFLCLRFDKSSSLHAQEDRWNVLHYKWPGDDIVVWISQSGILELASVCKVVAGCIWSLRANDWHVRSDTILLLFQSVLVHCSRFSQFLLVYQDGKWSA